MSSGLFETSKESESVFPETQENDEPIFVNPVLLDSAEALFRKRLALQPDDKNSLLALVQVHRKQGKIAEAQQLLERLLHLEPKNEEAIYLYAVLSGAEPPFVTRPAPFVFMKDFLDQDFHQSLLPYAISVQNEFVPATVGEGIYNPNHRVSLDLPGKRDVKDRFRTQVEEILPDVVRRLNVPKFQVEQIEVKLRVYQDGHFFKAHMDSPQDRRDSASRIVSFVYFFHKEPRPFSGGDLLLFDSDVESNRYTTSRLTRVIPENNCLIFFPSAYWHCVIPLCCPSGAFDDSRFVINGHIHRRVKVIEKPQPKPQQTAESSPNEPSAAS